MTKQAVPSDRPYQLCVRCVMDTSDPKITFDADGVCNHCTTALAQRETVWLRGADGNAAFDAAIRQMKAARVGDYDCILGLSGGMDSSYLAYEIVKRGVQPLVVHVDAGWNSDVAVSNIHTLVSKLGLDLATRVIPWDEMRDVQIAYLRSGLTNQDTPQDHALFAGLYGFAVENKIRYVLSGWNFATESILPWAWSDAPMDGKQVRAIHRRFGSRPLSEFPVLSYRKYYLDYELIRRMRVVKPLNWVPYSKDLARDTLMSEFGWRDYGGKHQESRWTKFFQGYFLPRYFGYDKRRPHLASLIVAGQTTRDEALALLEKPPYEPDAVEIEIDYISRKLGLSTAEFQELLAAPKHPHTDYPNDELFMKLMRAGRRVLGR